MKYPKSILNDICFMVTGHPHRLFREQMARVREVQSTILFQLLADNERTSFGRQFGLEKVTNIKSYRERVPVMTYDDYRPWIERIRQGESHVLTREPVMMLQPTGGSSGGSKLIPYTRSLQREFQHGILAWWHDLYGQNPELRRGPSYWSITPILQHTQQSGAVPVGFGHDADYFGWRGQLLSGVQAVPSAITTLRQLENFRYLTAYFLLRCANLVLISVWNPTFLILLMRDIEQYYDQIVSDMESGQIQLPAGEDMRRLQSYFQADPLRAHELKSLGTTDGRHDYGQIWKQLKVISCWTDNAAAGYAQRVQDMFPGVTLQGKGLLATEAMITLPWAEAGGNIPAYRSHFLEFIHVVDRKPYLIDELVVGETYQVVVTTGGGLYRYDLGDRVRVKGQAIGMPLLEFVGRDQVVDLVGEKLQEGHVRQAVTAVLTRLHIEPRFVMLAPKRTDTGGYYILYIETVEPEQESQLRQARVLIDSALKENMQYAYARNIGQLNQLKVFQVRCHGDRSFYQRCLHEGQRMGDVKPSFLDRRTDWDRYFQGRLLETEDMSETNHGETHTGGPA